MPGKEIHTHLKKKKRSQDWKVIGSESVSIIDLFGLVLHIAAFILGIVAVAGLAIFENGTGAHIEEGLEILTIIVVGLIILLAVVRKPIKALIIKSMLFNFWGTNKVKTVITMPTSIAWKQDGVGIVKASSSRSNNEDVYVGWVRVGFFRKKQLAIAFSIPASGRWMKWANKEGFITGYYVPRVIVVDVEKRHLTMFTNVTFENGEKDDDREMVFKIDALNKKATWSGVFPKYPFYGEWQWEEGSGEQDSKWRVQKEKFINARVQKKLDKKDK